MSEFCSFLVFRPDQIGLVHSLCTAAKWSTRDIPDPSMRYSFSEMGWSEAAQAFAAKNIGFHGEGQLVGRLLLLETEQPEANNIIQLICAANLILEGWPAIQDLPSCGFKLSDDEEDRPRTFEKVFRSDGFFQWFTYRPGLPIAVAIAAKAWDDKKLLYAVHKLARSYETESVSPWSMHPRHGQAFEKHTTNFASHVSTSMAINLAYAAIEELQLGVKASIEEPRNIGAKGKFEWNPKILESLQVRLQEAGVEPDTTIDWVTRGDQTEVDVYKMIDTPSDHSNGMEVRDRKVSLPDAINFCEYLRNMMTAHAFSQKTSRLGPYEVYNVQQVARFLIFSKCNLRNTSIEDLQRLYA